MCVRGTVFRMQGPYSQGEAVAEGVNFADDVDTGHAEQSSAQHVPPPHSAASGYRRGRRHVYQGDCSAELGGSSSAAFHSNDAFDSSEIGKQSGASHQPTGAYMRSNKAFDMSEKSNPTARSVRLRVPESEGLASGTINDAPTFGSNSLTKNLTIGTSFDSCIEPMVR